MKDSKKNKIKNIDHIREENNSIPNEVDEKDSDIRWKSRREKKAKRKGVLKYIIIAVLVLAVAYLMVSLFINSSSGVNHSALSGKTEMEIVGKTDFCVFDKYIVSCNQNGVFAYNHNNELQWKIEQVLSSPSLYTKDDTLLVTDFSRKSAFTVGKNGKIISDISFGADCINTSLNKNGWVTAILYANGYKGQVAVYDNEGKLRYTWNSANNDIISAELCDDNTILAVSQIDAVSSAEANGVISLFDITTEGKPFAGLNNNENIVSYIRWSGKNLVCVGNLGAFKINNSGNELWKYDFAGEMAMYNATNDNVFAFALNSSNTSSAKTYTVYTINDDGKELGNSEITGELRSIEVTGSDVAAVTSDKIYLLKKNAVLKSIYTLSRDISKGFVLDGGKKYFVISGASAEILALK